MVSAKIITRKAIYHCAARPLHLTPAFKAWRLRPRNSASLAFRTVKRQERRSLYVGPP